MVRYLYMLRTRLGKRHRKSAFGGHSGHGARDSEGEIARHAGKHRRKARNIAHENKPEQGPDPTHGAIHYLRITTTSSRSRPRPTEG